MEWGEKTNSPYDHHYHHLNPGHQRNIFYFYNLFHQLTAKLKIGPHGPSAAQPAEVEPRPEEEELFKRQRTEELLVQLWKKKSLATLTNAQVIYVILIIPLGIFCAMCHIPSSTIIKSQTQVPQTPTRTTTTVTILQPHWLLRGSLSQFSSLSFVKYFSV